MSARILLVDDHAAVRRGLRSLLSSHPDLEIVGEAEDGFEAVEKAKTLRPDLVLMDIAMPRMDGLQAATILAQEVPESKIIIISQNDPRVTRRQAEQVNAAAYIPKSELYAGLLPTLAKVLGFGTAASGAQITQSPAWLVGGGEMGHLIRQHDWSKTPLGPIEGWAPCLQTAVNLIVSSQHPMWVGWGPDITFLYNDAYIDVLSQSKHPWALGRAAAEVWSEIWDICGPLTDKVFQDGDASFVDEVRLFMNRGSWLEETYYSFSYSPIRVTAGSVEGLFCPSTDVTHRVINARRLRTLSELSAGALMQKTTEAACAAAAAILAKNVDDIPFAALYLLDSDSTARLEQTSVIVRGLADLTPESIDLKNEDKTKIPWPMAEVVERATSRVVSVKEVEGLPLGAAQQSLCDAVLLPVFTRVENRPLGVLIAGVNPTRGLDGEYRTFFELVSGQIATAIQNARAAEEEKKRMEALADIDHAKTAFFSNVSHEFRTPLTLMLGPIEELLARSHTDLSPAAKSRLEIANRNGSRLLRLVNNLLDFSRLEAGRMQAAMYQPTDLPAFTMELAGVFRSAIEKAWLRLELDCPRLPEPVFVDRNMWEKIVLNLISNAFKFTLQGEITVSLRQRDKDVELRVRDTGVGIPAHELPRVFDRFHRIENSRSRTHEGSGIGLALVQELTRLHGGSVRVESTEGKGSTFIVSIPLGSAHLPADRIGKTRALNSTTSGAIPFVEEALRWIPDTGNRESVEEMHQADELMPVPCPPISNIDPAQDKRPRILVADDNADMRQYLVRLLCERYQVQTVPDGEAALAAIREHPPELVLTDVMMPNLDGFGLLRALRSESKTRTIPIIVLSARAGEEARVEGMEVGADDYLVKPFSARELLARVQTHLDLARLRRESQRALARRTAQFEAVLNASPLGVYLIDSDFRILEMNPTAHAVFEDIPNPIGEDLDKVLHILWPHPYADELVRRFRHTLATGESYVEHEKIERRLDLGTREYYEWQINRIPLPDGGHGVVCYFRDIARMVQAREAIAESESRLRLATEAAELGIWHWYPDEDRTEWENSRVYEIFGRAREDGPANFAEFITKIIHPDDVPAFSQAITEMLENGVRFFFQGRICRGDGSRRWVEFTAQAAPKTGQSPLHVIGTALDITERKQAEERERQVTEEAVAATAKFRAVFEQTPVFAALTATDGTVLEANRLCLDACGYREEEVLGRPFWDCGWWRDSGEVRERIRTLMRNAAEGIAGRETLPCHWADGSRRQIDFAVHPIRDGQGRILFLHPTGVDITEIKHTEENYRRLAETLDAEVRARTSELEQRNVEIVRQSELLQDFSQRLMRVQDEERRHVARELHDSSGQILTTLAMSLSTIAAHARQSHSPMVGETEESERLVRQLSQEIRTMSYLLHPPLLDEIGVAEALRWYIEGLTERSGLSIKLDVPDDFGRLSRDMELVIFRLVQECLTNIHRHSESDSAEIGLARRANSLALTVRDRGRGISPERLSQIQSQASGVGFRGMRERVRRFDGRMTIESSSQGTTISFQFPLQKAEQSKAAG